ncbi:MAG: HAMP domain-containing protein [Saprospiraceae bacterium]|nr:HAMP domain-containing protein [Saprospiraceae bacterium]
MIPSISIRTRLILLIALTTIGILMSILFVVYRNVHNEVLQKVIADFDKTRDFFYRQETLVYDRLVESCLLIGQNPAFKANLALAHPPSIYQAVEELASFTKTDLFIVTDNNGQVMAWLDRPDLIGSSIIDKPEVGNILSGATSVLDLEQRPVLWEVDNGLYQVVTAPVEVDGRQLGSITLGSRFSDYEAIELKGTSKIDIHIFLNDQLIGTSLSKAEEITDRLFNEFLIKNKINIEQALIGNTEERVFTTLFLGEENFVFAKGLGDGAKGYYIATTPKSIELELLGHLLQKIVFIGLIGFLIAALLAYLLGNQFTRPVLALVKAMDTVRSGDLHVNLDNASRDEFGRLTRAFNEMVQAFKERLYLSRYVGSHTLRMISKSDNPDVELGQRLEMTVLFSDIRGFTSYAESRDPAETITMLNAWLGFQSEAVHHFGGVIDKYVGDEILALFSGTDSAERAWSCASNIQKKAALLALERNETLAVGIGIHFGPVVMGNVGAGDRLDYTVIGATVNLAARLCSAAKGGEVVLTTSTSRLIAAHWDDSSVEYIQLKGVSESVSIHRIPITTIET